MAWLLAFGITRIMKKPLPRKVQLGAVALIALVLGAAGPAVSRSYHVSSEASLYEKLSKPSTSSYEWDRYAREVPKEFQRKGWQNQKYVAKVREAKGNAKQLHDVLKAIAADKDTDKLGGARKAAEKELASLYDTGKARLYAPPRSGSAPEFPVDENLRGAFGGILAELSDSPDPSIYVSFTTSANLAPPPETDEALKLYRDDPGVREAFPKGDIPVIDAGDAFSPSFDQRRRTTFITAMSESFAKVFDSELISLVPLEKSASRDGKIVIEVSSNISRQADFFIYSAEVTPGVKRVKGLLFSIAVEWQFKIIDRDGKVVYEAPITTSEAAERVRIQRGENDPKWALYSIMMDSAYYNYSREVAGRFGFEPAPVKDSFSYGAASASATTGPSLDP
jgi:hypothetical protein